MHKYIPTDRDIASWRGIWRVAGLGNDKRRAVMIVGSPTALEIIEKDVILDIDVLGAKVNIDMFIPTLLIVKQISFNGYLIATTDSDQVVIVAIVKNAISEDKVLAVQKPDKMGVPSFTVRPRAGEFKTLKADI